VDTLAGAFKAHLRDVRGFALSTVQRQGRIVAEFLTWLRFKELPYGLASLSAIDIEGFLRHLDRRMGRVSLGLALELPLTDAVGPAIHDYLAEVPRYGPYQEVFLPLNAPGGPLKPTAVIEAFQAWFIRSGLEIPFKGVHCLHHSYALAPPRLVLENDRRRAGPSNAGAHHRLPPPSHRASAPRGATGAVFGPSAWKGGAMNITYTFHSVLAPDLRRYIALKQLPGRCRPVNV
jgi:hypothetical protein